MGRLRMLPWRCLPLSNWDLKRSGTPHVRRLTRSMASYDCKSEISRLLCFGDGQSMIFASFYFGQRIKEESKSESRRLKDVRQPEARVDWRGIWRLCDNHADWDCHGGWNIGKEVFIHESGGQKEIKRRPSKTFYNVFLPLYHRQNANVRFQRQFLYPIKLELVPMLSIN
jgi:hypothetical protein